jgi:hypothetical protein
LVCLASPVSNRVIMQSKKQQCSNIGYNTGTVGVVLVFN